MSMLRQRALATFFFPQRAHLKPGVIVGAEGKVVDAQHHSHGVVWV